MFVIGVTVVDPDAALVTVAGESACSFEACLPIIVINILEMA